MTERTYRVFAFSISIINAVRFRPTEFRVRSRADHAPRIMRPIIYSCQLREDGQLPPIKMFRPEWLTTRRRGDSTWEKERRGAGSSWLRSCLSTTRSYE